MGRVFLSAVACFSLQDVKNEGCRVMCTRSEYDGGRAIGKNFENCECFDTKQYTKLAENARDARPTPTPDPKRKKVDGLVIDYKKYPLRYSGEAAKAEDSDRPTYYYDRSHEYDLGPSDPELNGDE